MTLKDKEVQIAKIAIVISICTLAVSFLSFLISIYSVSLSNKTYQKSLNPILLVQFKQDVINGEYKLQLLNDGPNTIYNIRLLKYVRGFDPDVMQDAISTFPTQTIKPVCWKKIKIMVPDDEEILNIPYVELMNTWNLAQTSRRENIYAIHCLLIEYHREPDKKKFHNIKYLYVENNQKENNLFVYDLDVPLLDYFIPIRECLAKIDSKLLPILSKPE